MKEENKECYKENKKDGNQIIHYILMEELKKNNNTQTTSKLISKIILKTKPLKKFQTNKLFYPEETTTLVNLISKKDILETLKMIKVPQLKNYPSDLNTDKPKTTQKPTSKDKID